MGRIKANDELYSDKTKNPVVRDTYVLHGNQWLDEVVDGLATDTGKKANRDYVDAELAKKANVSTVTELTNTVNTKANASTVTELAKTVDTKASTADVTVLQTKTAALETTVSGKADNTTVSLLSERVTENTTKTVDLQSQIDSLVIEAGGDSNPEVVQARTDASGVTHATLKSRIDSEVTDLKSDLNILTGRSKIEWNTPISGYSYIDTSESPVNLLDVKTSTNHYQYAILDAEFGDKFTINGSGGSKARLWCFIDANGNILSNSEANAAGGNLEITAPENSTKLILNNNTITDASYTGIVPQKAIKELNNQLDSNVDDIKRDLFRKSNNRVNLLTDAYKTDGKYRNKNGALRDGDEFQMFDFVPVTPNTTYYLGVGLNTQIVFWDKNKDFISGRTTGAQQYSSSVGCISDLYITTPDGCYYTTISNDKAYNACLYLGNTAIFDDTKPNFIENALDIPVLKFSDIVGIPEGISKVCGENLFNKNAVVPNTYVFHGYLDTLQNYASYFFKVKGGAQYTTKGFYNNHYSFMDASFVNISNGTSVHDTTITAPSNAVYMGVSSDLSESNLDDMAICEGTTAIFSEFGSGDAYKLGSTQLDVGIGKEFETISAAVSAADDGDIIVVHEGTYTESVKCMKNVHIVGVSKTNCILQHKNNDYMNPPLEMAKGSIRNLTIHGYHANEAISENGEAYSMHTDWSQSENSALYCENVRFVNDTFRPIGCGLRKNFTLEFVNCEFLCKGEEYSVYCHDWNSRTVSDYGQRLIFRDCTIKTVGGNYAILLQSQELLAQCAEVTFQRCIVVNTAHPTQIIRGSKWNESIGGGNYLDTSDWILTDISGLNNADILNF